MENDRTMPVLAGMASRVVKHARAGEEPTTCESYQTLVKQLGIGRAHRLLRWGLDPEDHRDDRLNALTKETK